MNRTILLALGIFFTIAASVTGLVIIPNWQFQDLKPVVKATGLQYPEQYFGDAKKGRQVYISQGCIYCHTQQVREKGYGGDIRRGWGSRRSVPRDYLFDRPHQLGTMRTGPDLASIAARQPSVEWHTLHLYNPQITSPGSVMPRFNYLFTEIPADTATSRLPVGAVKIPDQFQSGGVKYILPTDRGNQLITYLKRLNQSFPLPEANQ
jgi:cytochrome c oxidase cbb3-type subunit II